MRHISLLAPAALNQMQTDLARFEAAPAHFHSLSDARRQARRTIHRLYPPSLARPLRRSKYHKMDKQIKG